MPVEGERVANCEGLPGRYGAAEPAYEAERGRGTLRHLDLDADFGALGRGADQIDAFTVERKAAHQILDSREGFDDGGLARSVLTVYSHHAGTEGAVLEADRAVSNVFHI